MKKLITLTTLALLSSSSYVLANAGPAPMPAPEPAPVAKMNPFSGFLIGGQLGLGAQDTSVKQRLVNRNNARSSSDLGGTGFMGGVGIGYGWLFNRFYAGLETNYNFSSIDGKHKTLALAGNFDHNAKLEGVWDISARLGMTLGANNNVLAYIKPGVAFGQWKSRAYNQNNGTGRSSKSVTGFLIGAGMDVALSDRMSMGVEYTYTAYGSFSYNQTVVVNNAQTSRVTIDPSAHAFMAHLKFKVF
jgi:outer membrane immunogenic protein